MLLRLTLLVFFASTCIAPAAAQSPSITDYFVGTWTCRSALGAQGVKAYGLSDGGKTLVLANPFVTAASTFGSFTETYVQNGAMLTVTQKSGSFTFTATSSGWNGNTLAFLGSVVNGSQTVPRRMTYQRTDANHFTRMFETGASDSGPWKSSSQESCTRLSASGMAPVIAGNASPTALAALTARIAGTNARELFVGTLPDDWHDTVPLPAGAQLFGSVERGTETSIYYDFGTTTLADYTASLQKAGWSMNSALTAAMPSGFGTQPAIPSVFCGSSAQPQISVTTPTGPDRSASVTVGPAGPLCSSGGPLAMIAQLRGPVPAPAGATLTGSALPFRFGASSAKLVSKAPLATLLDAFAAQMVAAKWTRLDTSVGPRTASASFSLTANGTPWAAVITIYAAPDTNDTYYTLVDSTNLSGEALPGLLTGSR